MSKPKAYEYEIGANSILVKRMLGGGANLVSPSRRNTKG